MGDSFVLDIYLVMRTGDKNCLTYMFKYGVTFLRINTIAKLGNVGFIQNSK